MHIPNLPTSNMALLGGVLVGFLLMFTTSVAIDVDPRYPSTPSCPPQTTNQTFFFPNPYNCSTYYICSNEVAIEQSCPPNLQFNPAVSTCDFPFNFNCTESSQEMIYPVNCGGKTIVPNPYDCHSFLRCLEDHYADVIKCPPGLLFNPKLMVCDWKDDVEC